MALTGSCSGMSRRPTTSSSRAPRSEERRVGHVAGRAPTRDNLLVFYFPDAEDWQSAVRKMREAGFEPVSAFNPYWDREGVTFEDPDGYRVVLQKAAWTR